jgi:hypothetical protein
VVTGDRELAASASPSPEVLPVEVEEVEVDVAVDWDGVDVVLVLVLDVLEADVLAAVAEVFVVFEDLIGVVVAPCEPPAAIAAQASAKALRLAAATWRRVRAMRPARARRSCSRRACSRRAVGALRSPELVGSALVFDMGAN